MHLRKSIRKVSVEADHKRDPRGARHPGAEQAHRTDGYEEPTGTPNDRERQPYRDPMVCLWYTPDDTDLALRECRDQHERAQDVNQSD